MTSMDNLRASKMPGPAIRISCQPPSHGWLTLTVLVDGQTVEIDASDVPNNPVEDLLAALDLAASGVESSVWWHLEPDGYFMYFTPNSEGVNFKLVFAPGSVLAKGRDVLAIHGSPAQILMPFWRLVRQFQSHESKQQHWPHTDLTRVLEVKGKIKQAGGESVE